MPIYSKNPFKLFFLATSRPITFELGIQHQGLGPYKVCSNDDPGLTLSDLTYNKVNLYFYTLNLETNS